MTAWIGQAYNATTYGAAQGEVECLVLGEHSARELAAYNAGVLSYAPEPNGVFKPIAFCGKPVVPAHHYAPLHTVELHCRDVHGRPVVVPLR